MERARTVLMKLLNLRKIWLIARREYLYNFRRRSFLFTAFVLPLIMITVISLIFGFFEQNMEDVSGSRLIGLVDTAAVIVRQSGKARIQLPQLFKLMGN